MKGRDETKISFRIDTDMAQVLKEVAELNYQTVSAYIRQQLEKALQEELK